MRSTFEANLTSLPMFTSDEPADEGFLGTLSLVSDKTKKGLRRLPSMYVGRGQVFADRSTERVIERLHRSLRAAEEGRRVPTYSLTACEFEGSMGLYGYDFYNRSPFKRKLMRAGMRFSEDAYVQMKPEGTFVAEDWVEFVPEFAVLGGAPGPDVVPASEGFLAFTIAATRLGTLDPAELALLVQLARGMKGLSSQDPSNLLESLRPSLRS